MENQRAQVRPNRGRRACAYRAAAIGFVDTRSALTALLCAFGTKFRIFDQEKPLSLRLAVSR
eukprot:1351301-Amorphochlora_amoeboformis.AAC.1